MTATTTAGLFSHETTTQLIVEPLFRTSVALRTLTVIRTDSSEYWLPTVGLGSAAFVAELDPIADANLSASMVHVVPKKVGAIQTVSNEAAADANAANIIGQAIVSGLADETDKAFFLGVTDGPEGLPGIAGVEEVILDPTEPLDAITDGITVIEANGGQASAIYMGPESWGDLSKLKVTDDSRQPVLSPQGGLDSAQPRSLFGLPVYVTRHLEDEMWVLDKARTVAVVRLPFTAAVGAGTAFELDGVQVRATGRVEFASVYPATVAHLTPGT
jgi:HK97 family phage major capsid protein